MDYSISKLKQVSLFVNIANNKKYIYVYYNNQNIKLSYMFVVVYLHLLIIIIIHLILKKILFPEKNMKMS